MFGAYTINALYDAALALAYPQSCAVCEGEVESRFDGVACGSCWQETRLLGDDDTLCWKCGALALSGIAEEKREAVRCHRCDDGEFSAARACGLYQGALRAAIIELKRAPNVPRRLQQLLVQTCRRAPLDSATVIVPVPLHPERERERGFNQALVLARALSRQIHLPVRENCLIRIEHTERHRAGLDARARRESVADAFAVTQPLTIADEHILLVDDVFTTGATVSACARVMLAAGASEVLVLSSARQADTR
jgi:ComF family protein